MKELLTRTECTAMRGIAIIGIVLHNYCHFNGRILQENEYQYLSFNSDRLWQVLSHPDELLPIHLLSFFGHYGVPVFLFLSGYGLVRKYEAACDASPSVGRFTRYNYLKLLRMLIVGFSLFLMVDVVTPGRFTFHWYNVLAQLLMVINVLPEPDKIIWPGIYWFFGLMMEFYLVYRLLLYRRSNWYVAALIVVCWLLQAFSAPDGDVLNHLRYNFIGGMLPFGLGLFAGRWSGRGVSYRQTGSFLPTNYEFPTDKPWLWWVVFLGASLLTLAMSFNFQSWLWIPVVIIVGTVALVRALPLWLLKGVVWFGGLSAAMFVAHPIARKFFLVVALKQDLYDGLVLYVIATIALSWAVRQIIDRIPKPTL